MGDSKLGCIVFDQDGTFYSIDSRHAQILRQKTKHWLMKKLDMSKDQIDRLYNRLRREYPNPFHGLATVGASIEEYHSNVFEAVSPSVHLRYDKNLVNVLRALPQSKYIVTLASPPYSEALQKCLGIRSIVQATLFVSNFPPEYSKKACYKVIAEKMQMDYSEICVVGDNFHLDLAPALKLGCQIVHISNRPVSGCHKTIRTIYQLSDILTRC